MNERIGPYVVDGRIGMGGMGVVYAAHDEALHRRVALKVISPQLADDEEFRARFVREARAMASLESPHVVSVFAHGETDGQLWMATQFFPDGDLGTLLRRSGPPSVAEGVELMAQVADGLAAAHAVGLVHRDIKPANVLLRRTGLTWGAALSDFGIARVGTDQTGLTQGGMVGTPSFMAPELHTGGEASVASDVYSMGCLLWTTLAGTAPFAGTTDYEVVSAHIEQPVPQLQGEGPLVPAVNRVLARAMAKEPSRRHRDAAELRDELRTAAREAIGGPTVVRRAVPGSSAPAAPPASSPGGHHDATPRSGHRRELLVGLVAVAVLLVGAGATYLAWPERQVATTVSPSDPTPGASDAEEEGETEVPDDPQETPEETPEETPQDTPSSASGGASRIPEPGPDGWSASDRTSAEESLASALLTQPMVTPESAECVSRAILDGEGLDLMVEGRFFDDSWTYVDQDLGAHPEIKSLFTTATLGCVTAG